MAERLYNTQQVAQLLGTSPREIGDWIRQGRLQAERMPGGNVCVGESSLVRFLKAQGVDLEEVMARVALAEGKPPQAGADPPPAAQGIAARKAALATAAATPAPGVRAPDVATASSPPPPDGDAAAIADAILGDAVERHATAIYLESQADGLALRLRIAGRLYEKANFRRRLPSALAADLLARFEQMAGVDPGGPRAPHEGAFSRRLAGRDIEFHVSACTTPHGRHLVICLDVIAGE